MLKRIILTAIFLGPAAAWALYKPVRVLAPQLVKGISCVTNTICLEDTDRYAEAKNLYANALAFVDSQDPTSENRYRNTDPDLKSGIGHRQKSDMGSCRKPVKPHNYRFHWV